jgi:hypothetical protein
VAKKTNTIAKIGFDVVTFSDAGRPHSLCDDPSKDVLKLLAGRPATGPPLLTVQETAALLRCSVSSLNKWRVNGLGPRFVRIGSRIRYRAADLAAYVAEQTRNSTSATTAPEPPRGLMKIPPRVRAGG